MDATDSSRSRGRAAWVWPAGAVVLALAVRLWLAARSSGLTMDSPLYVRMAESIASGPHEPQPAHEGYSLLVLLASRLLPGRELPGRALSLVASLALRYAQGSWSLTPKTVLVHAAATGVHGGEWRLADSTALGDTAPLPARLRRDGLAILAAYPARLIETLRQVLNAWPLPLLVLSMVGLTDAAGRGPWIIFPAVLFVYPLPAAPADLRFAKLAVLALAIPPAAGSQAISRL